MSRLSFVLLVLIGCSADDASDVERARPCDQLLEHMLDLSESGARNAPKELAAHREAMRRAIGPRFLESCEHDMTSEQIECGTKAGDLASATTCVATNAAPSSSAQ